MADRVVDRRMLLRGAGVAGATAIGGTALATSAHADSDNDVSGAWVIATGTTRRPSRPGHTVIAFAEGGVFIAQDIAPCRPRWRRRLESRAVATGSR